MTKHFNPRTREGCDKKYLSVGLRRNISIHAPVKGATALTPIGCITINISIHAPVKGATAWTAWQQADLMRFQSTHP
ncbi:hypothetical protein G153_13084 [Megasphaera sp. BL7]|nr:hypothetical protein G153_13084 [Megasphaera sp. BL7]EPP17874.1 hypothetical protein NM10_06721 [Megasphaera sp. NM10]